MNLQLPPNIENALRQQAAAAGMDVQQFAIAALQNGLGETAQSDAMLPRDK